ncbi:unnamed protein product [Camellia sinensis]
MTLGTSTTQAYGEAWYWDNRYAQEAGPFDWYQKYPSLSPLLRLYVPSHHRVLVVGSADTSTFAFEHQREVSFSEGMTDDGYGDVVNIDISSVVIEAMQKKYTDIKMDARDMSAFQTGSFDAVIDKGTLDSLLCGSNSQINAARMLEELMTNYRVLKDKGVYILITYGVPISRLRLLRDSCSWTIKLHVIDKLMSEGGSGHQKWELTSPIPLDDGGSSVEAALGKNPDVHYIYVCIKENSLRPSLDHETAMD